MKKKSHLPLASRGVVDSALKGPSNWVHVLWATWKVFRHGRQKTGNDKLSLLDGMVMLAQSVTRANRLWLATRLADVWGLPSAVEFAKKHVHPVQRPAVSLLEANMNAGDDTKWTECVNRYLAAVNTKPIQLASGTDPLFLRLMGDQGRQISDGPLVSVIMSAYNAATYLAHAASSILSQTWRNIELIIVDDCSTDDTWEVAQTIAKNDGRVKLLRNKVNVGPYVSRNLALRSARGRYITCHDADDWAHPQRIEVAMDVMTGQPGVKAVLAKMLRMSERGEFRFFSYRRPMPVEGARRTAMISLVIDAAYLRHYLGGWDSVRFGADSEFIDRLIKVSGNNVRRIEHISLFCLDLETSLTNHPRHGIPKAKGSSPIRAQYRKAFSKWHMRIREDDAKIPFPDSHRYYAIPAAMKVPDAAIRQNLDAHILQVDSQRRV